jgi:glucose/arabinose dehydrogenase
VSYRTIRRAAIFALTLFAALVGIVARTSDARSGPIAPTVSAGFVIETIAHVSAPRELAVASNGDLIVGTSGSSVAIVPDATGPPHPATTFVTMPDRTASGVALGAGSLYVGTYGGVWRIPYRTGDRIARATPERIAVERPGGGGHHVTTTIAVGRETLYASVGSSCNVCTESDTTRATIQEMAFDGNDRRNRATHIRNAIALAVDPATDALWAGVAGQDELAPGHPYEVFDDVSAHPGTADYGWPVCYENHRPVDGKRDCSAQTVARVALPAYETPVGAAFYVPGTGVHDFGERFRGGVFVALHGSWHTPLVEPRVVFVPMRRDEPTTAIDWNDPTKQWSTFVGGYQHDDGSRLGRPTGVAVAPDGSLFVADDLAGVIYRIRPKR